MHLPVKRNLTTAVSRACPDFRGALGHMDFDHKFHRDTVLRTSYGPCGFLSKIRRCRLAKSRSHGPEDRVTGRPDDRSNFRLLTCDTVLRTVREALPFANRADCKIQSPQHGLKALVTTELTGPRKNGHALCHAYHD
jgi:hypothetical protein